METIKINELSGMFKLLNCPIEIRFFKGLHDNVYHSIENVRIENIMSEVRLTDLATIIKLEASSGFSEEISSDMYKRVEYKKMRFVVDDKIYECICNSIFTDYDADYVDDKYTTYLTLEVLN